MTQTYDTYNFRPQDLDIWDCNNLRDLPGSIQTKLIGIYQRAFSMPPYEEEFDQESARDAFEYIYGRNGDIKIGILNGDPVSFAAGFLKPDGSYFIEELAVEPEFQGNAFGRRVVEELITTAESRYPATIELRTSINNIKAINLYTSLGFQIDTSRVEQVPNLRKDGSFKLDERIYLIKPLFKNEMRENNLLRRVVIAYPSGNTTGIVFDNFTQSELRDNNTLNQRIMNTWKETANNYPEIEQCCFVTAPKDPSAIARVEMFGDEFCGNATRSVIRVITGGKEYSGFIEVSGVERPLAFSMEQDDTVKLEMPLPEDKSKLTEKLEEGILVKLDGISQLVVFDKKVSPRELLTEILNRGKYKLDQEQAVGVSVYDKDKKIAKFCVWVKDVNTVFDETACGSGTCAIGVASAMGIQESTEIEIIQPSGEIITTKTIYNKNSGTVELSEIAGEVDILFDGEFKLK